MTAASPLSEFPDATVFVIEDDDAMRMSLDRILTNAHYQTSCFRSPREFLANYHQQMFGCMVVDIELPEMSGLDLCSQLQRVGCELPFIVISGFANVPRVLEAFRQGAVDFLEKPFGRTQLLERVQMAVARNAETRRRARQLSDVMTRVESLTPREHEVLQLLSDGWEAKQIASRLGISPKTAHNHRARILEKMQVDNVAKLVRLLQVVQ